MCCGSWVSTASTAVDSGSVASVAASRSLFVSAFVSAVGYPRPVDTVAARRSRAICWTAPRPLKAGFAIVGDLEAR